MNGWIKLHRSILSHWVFSKDAFFKAWLVILLRANHDKAKLLVKDQVVVIERGQFFTSLSNLAEETGLSIQRLRNFLNKLEKDGMIRKESSPIWTKITVCNYNDYQGEQQAANKPATSPQHILNNKQEGQEETNNNKEGLCSDFISSFNQIKGSRYRKTEKVKRQFNARIKEGYKIGDIETAIKNALNQKWHQENPQYLTPEFITRPDKLEQYLNSSTGKPNSTRLSQGWGLSKDGSIVKF